MDVHIQNNEGKTKFMLLQNFADGNEMRNINYNLYTFRTSSNPCHLVKLEKLYVT